MTIFIVPIIYFRILNGVIKNESKKIIEKIKKKLNPEARS